MKASSQEPEAVAYCDLNIELLCSISPEIANLISICPNSKRDLQTTLMLLTSLQITLETLRNHPYLHQDDSPSPLVADSLPPILDKTQKALARVSAILDSHQKGDHGGEWQDSEHKSVTSLNRFLDGSMEALNLALDVFSFLSRQTCQTSHTSIADSRSNLLEDCRKLRSRWEDIARGHAYDQRPINELLASVDFAMAHLSTTASQNTDSISGDLPPAYNSLAQTGSPSNNFEDVKGRMRSHPDYSAKDESSQNPDPSNAAALKIQPKRLISIPRKAREHEVVHVTLTPDRTRVVIWSVDSLEVYSVTTGASLWRIGSHENGFVSDGLPSRFRGNVSFSPDGSAFCFAAQKSRCAYLMILRTRDGCTLGRREFRKREALFASISHNIQHIAIASLPPAKGQPGNVKVYAFDPSGADISGFITGRRPRPLSVDDCPSCIYSAFSPDDKHLVVLAECDNSKERPTVIQVFSLDTRSQVRRIKLDAPSTTTGPTPFMPRVLFSRSASPNPEGLGKQRWLVTSNTPGSFSFSTIDIMTGEKVLSIGGGTFPHWGHFLGAFGKKPVWAVTELDEETGTYTYALRRGEGKTSKICLNRGFWQRDDLPRRLKAQEETAMVTIEGQDAWSLSNDGRLAVVYSKDKARAYIMAL